MIVMLLILFLAITTQSSVVHYNLSNNDYSIKLLCMKCILFCKFIGGETAHHRCLVIINSFEQLLVCGDVCVCTPL